MTGSTWSSAENLISFGMSVSAVAVGDVPIERQAVEPVAVELSDVLPRVEAYDVTTAYLVGDELSFLVANVVVAQLQTVGELEVVVGPRDNRGVVFGVA